MAARAGIKYRSGALSREGNNRRVAGEVFYRDWRAVVAIAAKNARLCWASLHYGDDFRLYSAN
ncbi:hypothetical protein DTR82_17700 [Salmonella enterica subsp. enterica serovar Javiana]|nr:hypothetical protein [Salmonella enterica subsp. enterica serovar Javiana]